MIVTVINREGMHATSLPLKIAGGYWLYDESNSYSERLVSIEASGDEWVMKSNRQVRVIDGGGNTIKSVVLTPLSTYALAKRSGERVIVFTEPVTEDRQLFTKYEVLGNIVLSIGRVPGKDIWYESKTVSSNHASLSHDNNKWYIQDEGSANGTFVNGIKVRAAELAIGDVVYITGLKIIIGNSFIAVNNPDGKVRITDRIYKLKKQIIEPFNEDEEYELDEPEHFYRSPRFKRDIKTAQFKIDSPPASPVDEEMPWVLVFGSSMAMGMMSLVTLANAIINNNITSMMMGASMLIGTMLLPTITKKYERKRKHKKEALRQKKYHEYMEKISAQIDEECRRQENILRENNIPIQECESRIQEVKRNLWERAIGQNDFLRVRVGRGDGLIDAELHYQERKFTLEEDNLQEELYSIGETPKVLHNIPITYSIFDDYISGIIGPRNQVISFIKGLIIQLAALYSYDEVKLVFLYDTEENTEFEFVKWLPHVWTDDKKFRFVATNSNETKEVSAFLEKVIESRIETNENDMEDVTPYYVVFALSKSLAARGEMIKRILAEKRNLHMSVVAVYDELKNLPKECSMVVELAGDKARLFDKDDISGKSVDFVSDIYLTKNPLDLSVQLANISLDTSGGGYTLPSMYTFLEMLGVGKVEHLNARVRWQENDPTKSLKAAVGVDTLGDLFMLDLHEKFHGPHGLVAGMTGSGKSEFIISYILSLAVNYHPNEVAFILIDYKGGGMAKSFEYLPHTAGIITNLDGAAINRSLVSIESELERRQAIFGETSKKVGVSNIDIYKYQKLYREGAVSEPLQHLFIISDEFAELKTQQPEFMSKLVSAARIGRSLGVHLILATQKPSGVVDDQIWSNSRFRVCLKVQERADSMDMLKRADAAELTDTGRFYLQVGYNELFELGQSAWAGAPYYPSDKVQKEKDNGVVVVDMNGHPIKEVKIDRRKAKFADAKKQLDVITDYLRSIAEEDGIQVRPLWLQPIPAIIILDELKKKYRTRTDRFKLNPVIGEYDDPAHQRQGVLRLPLSDEGNAVVYGAAGAGKTSFLNAMIYSLIHDHSPNEVNLYILDFASETLRAFSRAPHVGEVVLSYESEKVSNLFKMLQKEVERRKKLFADYGGDYSSYMQMSNNPLPSIVVAINNFAAFTELYEEKEEAVSFLSREGTKYGLYFVLTSLGTGGVRFRLLQNFKQLFVLQLNDETDYSTIVGKTDGLYPAKHKGRGLVKRDALYEFQLACLTEDAVPYTLIQEKCRMLEMAWEGETARKIPILPEVVDIDFLKDYIDQGRLFPLPVGVEKHSLNVHKYPFDANYVNMVVSASLDYQGFLKNLTLLIGNYVKTHGVVFDMPKSIEEKFDSLVLASSTKDCETEIDKLFDLIVYRHNTYKEANEQAIACEAFEEIVVIINSLSQLKAALSEESSEKLSLILERGSRDYKVTIIIGEQSKAISSVSYEKWYKNHVSPSDGIWIGNGITEQYHMKPNKTSSEMHEEMTAEFGYSLIKGKALKVKLLYERTEEEMDDEQ